MGIKEDFQNIKAALMLKSPFLSSLLMRARIIVTSKVEKIEINENAEILVNENHINQFSNEDKAFLFAHAVLHLAFRHSERKRKENLAAWNIAADAVVNNLLNDILRPKNIDDLITIYNVYKLLTNAGIKVDEDELKQMSAEEIYRLLLKIPDPTPIMNLYNQAKNSASGLNSDLSQSSDTNRQRDNDESSGNTGGNGNKDSNEDNKEDSEQRGSGGKGNKKDNEQGSSNYSHTSPSTGKDEYVLQEGDPEIYRRNARSSGDDDTDTTVGDAWQKALVNAYMLQKSIGTLPGNLQRLIDKILKPKINWRALLRAAIREGLGRNIISTYKRRSRKHPLLPGSRRLVIPDIYCLIDTSGSITTQELEQFMGEVYELANIGRICAVPWDAKKYKPVQIKKKRDIEILKKYLEGGGGTRIYEALEHAWSNMRAGDVVIVFTDGDIEDIDKPNTTTMLYNIGAKASKAIFVTTKTDVEKPLWQTIHLTLD